MPLTLVEEVVKEQALEFGFLVVGRSDILEEDGLYARVMCGYSGQASSIL